MIRKNILVRSFLIIVGFIFLIEGSPKKVEAYNLFGYHNSNGITYQYYWTNPNNTTAWQRQKINDVFYNWNTSYKTGIITPMNINHTNNKDSSIIDWSYTTN